ncbi:hypothetical protein [Levilactobacillus brevis]|uniref:hypothetical protein n=1 Tax=Levilactobacillus brevis TaxID=1580 RepID=UPI0021A62D63|nr:hypothetical protein [Levilactobacillus brevis]
MRTQEKVTILMAVVSFITGVLLYVRITDYYQAADLWVEHFDSYLKTYIWVLWLLVGLLVLVDAVFLYLRYKEWDIGIWLGLGSVLIIFALGLVQFIRVPNYRDYHVTPYLISATAVEKQINQKTFTFDDRPIYFCRKTDPFYLQVKRKIRQYSLEQRNDIAYIDMKKMRRVLGEKRYLIVIRRAKVKSNNAIVYTYKGSQGHSKIVTFNNIQEPHRLKSALNFIDDGE